MFPERFRCTWFRWRERRHFQSHGRCYAHWRDEVQTERSWRSSRSRRHSCELIINSLFFFYSFFFCPVTPCICSPPPRRVKHPSSSPYTETKHTHDAWKTNRIPQTQNIQTPNTQHTQYHITLKTKGSLWHSGLHSRREERHLQYRGCRHALGHDEVQAKGTWRTSRTRGQRRTSYNTLAAKQIKKAANSSKTLLTCYFVVQQIASGASALFNSGRFNNSTDKTSQNNAYLPLLLNLPLLR